MITLVILACMISAPDRCETFEYPGAQSMLACYQGSLPMAALWSRQHPGWKLVKMTCEPGVGA